MAKPMINRGYFGNPLSIAIAISILLILVFVLAIEIMSDDFDPVPFPDDYHYWVPSVDVPNKNTHAKDGIQYIGAGELVGPEDIAIDHAAGVFYTGCEDGFIKKVKMHPSHPREPLVENWARVGGRPLGVALGRDRTLVVANANMGLQLVDQQGAVTLLTNEAEGVRFKLTDAVDVAEDGMIYFTDACSKYSFAETSRCALEGRPYGKLLRYDRKSNKTIVMADGLYFAAGLTVSEDQNSVIVTESMMRRCKRFYIRGEKKGTSDIFIDNLPGFPDNIRYDGNGQYWIGLAEGRNFAFDLVMKLPFLRKVMLALENYVEVFMLASNAGIMSVDLKGKPVSLYTDKAFDDATGGIKSDNLILFISIFKPYIRLIPITDEVASVAEISSMISPY